MLVETSQGHPLPGHLGGGVLATVSGVSQLPGGPSEIPPLMAGPAITEQSPIRLGEASVHGLEVAPRTVIDLVVESRNRPCCGSSNVAPTARRSWP